ncbi:Tachykinin-like peptides receptor 86C [Halotydeus destructor]|nr:Tachykinin-like peptides receptor 86C [Halotydeus destructor]
MTTIDLVEYYNATIPHFWNNVTQCVQARVSLSAGDEPVNGTSLLDSDGGQILQSCLKDMVGTTPYVSSVLIQLFWSLLFGAMVSVAVIGNAIVIWIILAHRRMRTVTNYFLLNLAIADLMMAAMNASFNYVFMLHSHWPFGATYCSVNNFIAHLTVFSSVFTITAMSVDRYVAIVKPLRPRMSRKTGIIIISIIWFAGCLVSLPVLLVSTTVSYIYPDGGVRTICYLQWPDGVSGASKIDYIFNVVFLITTYVIPVIAMAITYPWMGCVLWRSKTIGEINERQTVAIKTKKRIVRMLVVVVVIFTLCWFPYHLYFLVTYHYRDLVHSSYIQHIYLAIYFIAMSNSTVNPVIYYNMNGRYVTVHLALNCTQVHSFPL